MVGGGGGGGGVFMNSLGNFNSEHKNKTRHDSILKHYLQNMFTHR